MPVKSGLTLCLTFNDDQIASLKSKWSKNPRLVRIHSRADSPVWADMLGEIKPLLERKLVMNAARIMADKHSSAPMASMNNAASAKADEGLFIYRVLPKSQSPAASLVSNGLFKHNACKSVDSDIDSVKLNTESGDECDAFRDVESDVEVISVITDLDEDDEIFFKMPHFHEH